MHIFESIQANLRIYDKLNERVRDTYSYNNYDNLSKMEKDILEDTEYVNIPISAKINILEYVRNESSKSGHYIYMPQSIRKQMKDEYRGNFKEIRGLYFFKQYPKLFEFLYKDEKFRNKIKDYSVSSKEDFLDKPSNKKTKIPVTDADLDVQLKSKPNLNKEKPVETKPEETKPVETKSSEPVKTSSNVEKSTKPSNNNVSPEVNKVFNLLWRKSTSSARETMKTIAKDSRNSEEFRQKLLSKGNADIFNMSYGKDLAKLFYDKLKN